MKELTSLQHPLVKHLVKLREKKEYRFQCNKVLIGGVKLIKELSCEHAFKTVLIEKGYAPPFSFRADLTVTVPPEVLKKVTGVTCPEPLAAEIDLPQPTDRMASLSSVLILDGISDPGNMGTLLRTALALGWDGVMITPGSVDPFNEKALRAAKGATFHMPLKQASWKEVESFLKEFKGEIFAADPAGKPLQQKRPPPYALALGNESVGLSDMVKKRAHTIGIPMHHKMESLNVASAGAILMYLFAGNP